MEWRFWWIKSSLGPGRRVVPVADPVECKGAKKSQNSTTTGRKFADFVRTKNIPTSISSFFTAAGE